MYIQTIQKNMLDGIESNIEVAESQIYQLHLKFSALGISGNRTERRLILQQLGILKNNLELFKARRKHALQLAP